MESEEFPLVPEDNTSEFAVAECLEHMPGGIDSEEITVTASKNGMWPAVIPATANLDIAMARDRANILIFLYNSVPLSMTQWIHGDLGTNRKKKLLWKKRINGWEKDLRHALIGSDSIFQRTVHAHVLSHNTRVHIDNLWLGYQFHLKPISNEGLNAARDRLAVAESFRLSHDAHVKFLNDLINRKNKQLLRLLPTFNDLART
jgi:hypothetical protein